MSEESSKRRKLRLFCPSLSKMVPLMAWDEQRLDLGSIARTFGLDPSTVKLNGHFISRGVDLIASSVTWKSLLAFFSSRGLSTGTTDSDDLIVDGKLFKVGCKRGHTSDSESDISFTNESRYTSANRKPQLGANVRKNSWSAGNDLGFDNGADQINRCSGLSLKRKQLLEDVGLTKKTRMKETYSDLGGRENSLAGITSSIGSCSFINGSQKRSREDEVVVAFPTKKMR